MATTIKSEQGTFDFKIEGNDKLYSIPFAKYMPLRMAQRFQKLSLVKGEDEQAAAGTEMMVEILEKYCPDIVDDISANTAATILQAWQEADPDISLGE
jgi:hypothetical protein